MSRRVARRAQSRSPIRWTVAIGSVGLLAALPGPAGTALGAGSLSPAGHEDGHGVVFSQTNLVSDIPGLARITDSDVKNPWGLALGTDTPLWVSNQFNPASNNPAGPKDLLTKITIYAGANGQAPISKVPLEVTASSPTGIVFNPGPHFVVSRDGISAPSRFIWDENVPNAAFTGPDGVVTGWSPAVPPLTRGVRKVHRKDAFDTGIALGHTRNGPRLYIIGTFDGRISVYDGRFEDVTRPGTFVDPDIGDLQPYNVAVLDRHVYVAYGSETSGAISVFTKRGRLVGRLITGSHLVDPWGMVIAPSHWGRFGGDLLVGNVDDGKINAYDLSSGEWQGTLRDRTGQALVNPGLWGLAFGNGTIGTPRTLLFAAGIGDEVGRNIYEHGLVGAIRPVATDAR